MHSGDILVKEIFPSEPFEQNDRLKLALMISRRLMSFAANREK